jgi:hypothetical protein
MNGDKPLPAKDYIRVSMVAGVDPADVAFGSRDARFGDGEAEYALFNKGK